MNRKSHLLCIECCQNIAKVTSWNYEINSLPGFNLLFLKKLHISINIIGNLGDQPSNVNRIGG